MTKRRSPLAHMALVVVLLVTATGVLAQPVDARKLLGRRGLLGKIFRMTPLGRRVATLETRRDEYRAANNWLNERLDQANQRDAQLKVLLRKRWIDGHTYFKYKSLNEQRKAEYIELKDRMTKITRDKFMRTMGQEAVDVLVPAILRHAKFAKTVREVNEAFDTTKQFLQDGIAGIDKLAAKADFGFLGKLREKTQRLISKIDERKLAGILLEDVRARLEQLDQDLAETQRNLPEIVKPEFAKQVQQQAREAVQSLDATQAAVNQEVEKIKKQGTIHIPVRSAARDRRVQEKMKEFHLDATMTRRAIAEARLRKALGPRLDATMKAAMEKLGIDRADPRYGQIHTMAMERILEADASKLDDEKLTRLWQETLKEILEGYQELVEGPAIGVVTMELDETSLDWSDDGHPGWMMWGNFGLDTYPKEVPCFFQQCRTSMLLKIDKLDLQLDFDLDRGLTTGSFDGEATGGLLGSFGGDDYGPAKGSFRGQITEGWVKYNRNTRSWSFGGKGTVTMEMEGEGVCCDRCGCEGDSTLRTVLLKGKYENTIPVELEGRTLPGSLSIVGHHDDPYRWVFTLRCKECALPAVFPKK